MALIAKTAAKAARPRRAVRPVRESVRAGARGAYREAILAAAERVFARSGFYETRMADIAREAGVGVGTLYNYFESKEVIVGEILAQHHGDFRRRVDAAIADVEDPIERLRRLVSTCLGHLDEHGALFAMFLERGGTGECDVERLAGPRVQENYAEFLELLEKDLRVAIRERKIRSDTDPRLLVAMLSGAMNGATYAWLKRGRRGRLSAVADEILQLFLEGARRT